VSLDRDLVKSGMMDAWVGGCVGGWKERKMGVVGRRYGKGLSSEEEVREKECCLARKKRLRWTFGRKTAR
jgi:hypothetical protein